MIYKHLSVMDIRDPDTSLKTEKKRHGVCGYEYR